MEISSSLTQKKEEFLFYNFIESDFSHSQLFEEVSPFVESGNSSFVESGISSFVESRNSSHKKLSSKKVPHKCENEGCELLANYGFPDGKKRQFCSKHKEDGMIYYCTRCKTDGCEKEATFGFPPKEKGKSSREYCSHHKKDRMINLLYKKHRKCIYPGCDIVPSFGFTSNRKVVACRKHSLSGMVSFTKSKFCVYPGCKSYPNFGYPSGKREYCGLHKKDGMCSGRKKCEVEGCGVFPSFGFPSLPGEKGRGKRRFCAHHKMEGMINLRYRGASQLQNKISINTSNFD